MVDKPCKQRAKLSKHVTQALRAVFRALDDDPAVLAAARLAESKAIDALERHKKEHGCG